MKKTVIFTMAFFLLLIGTAFADWSVTVSWTHSTSTYMTEEKVFLGSEEICTVKTGETAACNFQRTDAQAEAVRGQMVTIVAYNDAGIASDPLSVGKFEPPQTPTAPTGGAILYQWVK